VYSLGASLYEMLALEPPFRGKDHEDTLSRIIECDPVEPRKSNPRIPRDLETIVLKCLRKDPADRYGTAESLGQDLRRFARGEPIEARPELPWERWLRRIRRERLKIAIVFLACLSLVALALLGVVQVRAARDMKLGTYRARVQDSLKKLEAAQATLIDPVAADFQGVNMIEFSGAEGRARVEEAVRDLGETTGLLPHLRDAWYHRARALLFLGRMPEAISDLNQAISRDPRFLPPRILKAAILLSSGNLEAAESEIEAARSATGDVSAQTWLGIYQARRWSSWREAESLFTKLIAMEEHGVQSYRDSVYDTRLGRGIARMHLQDYLGAIRDFEVACSRWPDSNEPFVCLGEACYRKGFREEAEQVFEGLYRASPQPSRAALAIAATYHGLKDSASGLKWMERVEDSVARDRLLVGFLAEEGRVKEALVAAERVLQASPHDHLAHRATGIALLGDGKYGQAEDSLRKALEVAPNDLLALHYLGTCLYRQKRFGESRAQYEKIIFRSPGNGYARTALAWIALEEEKLDEAEERVKQAIEVVPEWLEARILLAKILARKRKVDDAIAELEHAFVLARDLADAYPVSEVANAHSLAGWVYLDLGLVGKAEAAFRRSLDLAPGNRDAQEGLDRATSKRGGGGELPIELERSE
jgi:tetratricopeptide (TPR) repeat protein